MSTIMDDGVPFNPITRPTPDTPSSLNDRKIGGLGIHLVKELIDEVLYKRRVDKNEPTLVKNLESSQDG